MKGRPRLPTGAARETKLNVRLRKHELAALQERAKTRGVTVCALVRELLLGPVRDDW